jgi:hypothetical protein
MLLELFKFFVNELAILEKLLIVNLFYSPVFITPIAICIIVILAAYSTLHAHHSLLLFSFTLFFIRNKILCSQIYTI